MQISVHHICLGGDCIHSAFWCRLALMAHLILSYAPSSAVLWQIKNWHNKHKHSFIVRRQVHTVLSRSPFHVMFWQPATKCVGICHSHQHEAGHAVLCDNTSWSIARHCFPPSSLSSTIRLKYPSELCLLDLSSHRTLG